MSATEPSISASAASRQKINEDDHDLLTFNEASERLRVEIASAQTSVAELEHSGFGPALDKAQARLAALRAAAQRNAAQPINDMNFEKFFGYPGTAKRNLSTRPSSGDAVV